MKNKIPVLYVDDEELNLFIFKELMKEKYNVVLAESGIEGLEILEKQPEIQHVISDINMPLMTGLEFIEEATSRFGKKKYFVLTGYAINDEIQETIDSGLIIHAWTKPADFKKIDNWLLKN